MTLNAAEMFGPLSRGLDKGRVKRTITVTITYTEYESITEIDAERKAIRFKGDQQVADLSPIDPNITERMVSSVKSLLDRGN